VKAPDGPAKTLPITDGNAVAESVKKRLAQRKPFLVVLAGTDVGARQFIAGMCTVGREADCDLVLRDNRASKKHARFEQRGMQIFVVDLGSTNGTLLNDQRIEGEAPVRAGDKVIIGSTVMRFDWQDALEQDYHEEIERMLTLDELTGLLHKRRFDSEGAVLVESSLAAGKPVALLMMDLDGIKKINDTHGHAFGAHCISEAGRVLGVVVSERSGIATRWGGDEYAAVLPGFGALEAVAAGEEIIKAIREHHFEREGIVLEPGISIGAASGPEQGKTLEALYEKADEALYRAKRAGKGRVSL